MGTSSNLHLITASTSPPWYRFCRPAAPFPSASLVNSQSTAVESDPSWPMNGQGFSVASPSSTPCTNIGQEQANWLASLPLPPLPASSIPALLYDSLDEEEAELLEAQVLPPPPFRSCSPLLPAPTNSSSRPLTSVSNILHSPVIFGERLPKWSVLNCHDNNPHLPENLPRTASHDHPINLDAHLPSPPSFVSPLPPSHSGRDSLDENIPLRAVHLTSRASPTTPPVSAFARNPNPVGAMLEGICFTPVAVSGLTRPTVLKREPPDGAEQDMNSCFSEYEASHESPVFPNSSITKRYQFHL
uniref:Uncharacterized protein n=1 Tax=Schistocephalus solidus TaxID=70667 RepID=A0A0X3QEB6_SCHSO